jgi:drug/metabolite transporter (DMT)-like permease
MSNHHEPDAEQAEPFLRPSSSDDVELPELDGPRDERTPDSHYLRHVEGPPPAQGKPSPWMVALALFITVLGFTVNTEATAYFEDELGWKKPFATLYITHGALCLPWILHIAYLRSQRRDVRYPVWREEYISQLRASVATISAYTTDGPLMLFKRKGSLPGPLAYLFVAMGLMTLVLTVSGVSWFLSLSLTTPADLTAIYNSSTFFAALFSIPLLHERLGYPSIAAVALSLAGTFIIAYGDTTAVHTESEVGTNRLLGNIVACVGAIAFGLYEVLFKKWACSSTPSSPQSTLPLTLAASALTGFYTLLTLWLGLVVLHFTSVEVFVFPSLYTALWIAIAVLSGSISITLLAVLVIWTDPIFGSFANVLSVFFVALADWLVFGLQPSLATYVGGALVVVAFGLLAWDTFGAGPHGRSKG